MSPGCRHLPIGKAASSFRVQPAGADGLDAGVWVEVDERGLIDRITDYWAEPYDPPVGRAHLVQRW
jgi:hypothetical protein